MSLFENYKNEAEFRDNFIKPLLNRLGFFGVELKHGSQEFGKDFVFSELHRLGGTKHYAAQVKHEARISQGSAVDGLLSQIKQAFATSFRRGDSPRECHVSAVYVFNSGEITENAQKQMLDELGKERYGDNVHFLADGRLETIERYSSYEDDRILRNRLTGLNTQLELNKLVCEGLKTMDGKGSLDGRPLLLKSVEEVLCEPLDCEEFMVELYKYWQIASSMESMRLRLFVVKLAPESHKAQLDSVKKSASDLIQTTERIREILPVLMLRVQRIE